MIELLMEKLRFYLAVQMFIANTPDSTKIVYSGSQDYRVVDTCHCPTWFTYLFRHIRVDSVGHYTFTGDPFDTFEPKPFTYRKNPNRGGRDPYLSLTGAMQNCFVGRSAHEIFKLFGIQTGVLTTEYGYGYRLQYRLQFGYYRKVMPNFLGFILIITFEQGSELKIVSAYLDQGIYGEDH